MYSPRMCDKWPWLSSYTCKVSDESKTCSRFDTNSRLLLNWIQYFIDLAQHQRTFPLPNHFMGALSNSTFTQNKSQSFSASCAGEKSNRDLCCDRSCFVKSRRMKPSAFLNGRQFLLLPLSAGRRF